MKLKEIIKFLDEKIPKSLALPSDEIGFKKEYDLNQDITSIMICMDLLPKDDVACVYSKDSHIYNTLKLGHN